MNENAPANSYGEAGYRNITIRASEEMHAQLEILAEVNNRRIREETRLALEHWVDISRRDPQVIKRRDALRAKLERETARKLDAYGAVFGEGKQAGASPKEASSTAPSARGAKNPS